jgi:hypothetical protein
MTMTTTGAARFDQPIERRDLLSAKADRIRFLEVPDTRFFLVEGTGQAGGTEFTQAFAALYPVAYTVHFALKRRGVQAPVGALEGLFWIGEPGPITADQLAATPDPSRAWTWHLMLPVPEETTDEEIAAAIADVARKKAPPALARLRVETLAEGPSAQVLHVGPYTTEPGTITRLHAAIDAAGLRPRGCHHEIYLSDPGRTDPERIRTIIRQPVEPAG